MAVSYVSSSNSNYDNVNSVTTPLDCSGSNILVVFVMMYEDLLSTISGVTYNGTSMTAIDSYGPGFTSGFNAAYGRVYYLLNPSTGTNNIVTSFTSTASKRGEIVGVSLSGADTTTPIGNYDINNNITSTSTTFVVDVTNNDLLILTALSHYNVSNSFTFGAGQTAIYNSAYYRLYGVSRKEVATSGSNSLIVGLPSNKGGAGISIVINPSVALGTSNFFQLF